MFICPDTGTEFKHNVFSEIMRKIRDFRAANGLFLGDGWEQEVESRMCENYQFPVWRFEGEPELPRRTTLADVQRFLRVAAGWLSNGAELVDQAEADRRAELCAACPCNVTIEGCLPCHRLIDNAAGLLGNRATRYDGFLKGCAVCGCSNAAQVWFPLEALHKGVAPEMKFPSHCWKALPL